MAQTIVTICDACPDGPSFITEGVESFIINGNILDLCEAHAASMSFYDGAVMANLLGRRAEQNGTKPKKQKTQKRAIVDGTNHYDAPYETADGDWQCPFCEVTKATNRGARMHVTRAHG